MLSSILTRPLVKVTRNRKLFTYFPNLKDSVIWCREVFYRVWVNSGFFYLIVFHFVDLHVEEVGLVDGGVVVFGPGLKLIPHLRQPNSSSILPLLMQIVNRLRRHARLIILNNRLPLILRLRRKMHRPQHLRHFLLPSGPFVTGR